MEVDCNGRRDEFAVSFVPALLVTLTAVWLHCDDNLLQHQTSPSDGLASCEGEAVGERGGWRGEVQPQRSRSRSPAAARYGRIRRAGGVARRCLWNCAAVWSSAGSARGNLLLLNFCPSVCISLRTLQQMNRVTPAMTDAGLPTRFMPGSEIPHPHHKVCSPPATLLSPTAVSNHALEQCNEEHQTWPAPFNNPTILFDCW